MKLQTLAALAAGIALTSVASVLAIGAFDTNHAAARAAHVDADLLNDARSNFQPLAKDMATLEFPITPSRVELGRKLFFDPRISRASPLRRSGERRPRMPKPSKRDQLVQATKELLWEAGYEAMSPRDIQARSAAKPGSLYHHFPSKLAIAEVALGEAAAEEIARLEEVFSADSPPLEAVRRYLLLKRDAFRGCRLGRLVHEASIEYEELRRPVAALL